MGSFDVNDLKKRLQEEDAFIIELIDTIPPKMYFDKEVQEKIASEKHAHMDETIKGIQGRSGHKEASAKLKHKRARLNPYWQKSVSQIQEEISGKASKKSRNKGVLKCDSLTRAENIEELQQRLHEKVKELQAKRRGCSAQEFLERKRLKKEKKKLQKAKQKKGNVLKGKDSHPNVQNSEFQKPIKEKESNKPVYNKDGKVIFSKFEFLDAGLEAKKGSAFSGKNYKKLLSNVEKENEKINKLKEQDKKKADELLLKKSWKRAIEKAEGVKVKDDPVLLKKSLMKQEKKKHKNTKVWKEREDLVEKRKKARQEKRQRNIQNKKKEKQQAKLKRAKKKGRIIPGF